METETGGHLLSHSETILAANIIALVGIGKGSADSGLPRISKYRCALLKKEGLGTLDL